MGILTLIHIVGTFQSLNSELTKLSCLPQPPPPTSEGTHAVVLSLDRGCCEVFLNFLSF